MYHTYTHTLAGSHGIHGKLLSIRLVKVGARRNVCDNGNLSENREGCMDRWLHVSLVSARSRSFIQPMT